MNRFVVICLAVLISAGCGGDDNPLSSGSLEGSWDLRSMMVEFSDLVMVIDPPDAIGNLEITGNRYTVSITYSITGSDQTTTFSETGSYVASGNTITFDPDGDVPTYSTQLQGDGQQITIASSDTSDGATLSVTMVFGKRS